jgi:hypothetical protein
MRVSLLLSKWFDQVDSTVLTRLLNIVIGAFLLFIVDGLRSAHRRMSAGSVSNRLPIMDTITKYIECPEIS